MEQRLVRRDRQHGRNCKSDKRSSDIPGGDEGKDYVEGDLQGERPQWGVGSEAGTEALDHRRRHMEEDRVESDVGKARHRDRGVDGHCRREDHKDHQNRPIRGHQPRRTPHRIRGNAAELAVARDRRQEDDEAADDEQDVHELIQRSLDEVREPTRAEGREHAREAEQMQHDDPEDRVRAVAVERGHDWDVRGGPTLLSRVGGCRDRVDDASRGGISSARLIREDGVIGIRRYLRSHSTKPLTGSFSTRSKPRWRSICASCGIDAETRSSTIRPPSSSKRSIALSASRSDSSPSTLKNGDVFTTPARAAIRWSTDVPMISTCSPAVVWVSTKLCAAG